jgi:hypothetical protein
VAGSAGQLLYRWSETNFPEPAIEKQSTIKEASLDTEDRLARYGLGYRTFFSSA